MNTLPNEILVSIFTHLPQRYVVTICSTVCKSWNKVIIQPWLFSTIHIYTRQQLKRVIQLAKERKTITKDDKPISHYVKCINFHYEYTSQTKEDRAGLLLFPNLQHIVGLGNSYSSANFNNSIYLHFHQPTHYYYFYDHEQSIEKFNHIKNNLKSLNIYITKKLVNYIPQQEQEETIHIKSIGSRSNESDLNIPIKTLILPTESLTNLIKLRVDFHSQIFADRFEHLEFIIDEHIFENIHQSCPLLESLSLINFFMNISDEYHYNNNKRIVPTHYLKNINFSKGDFSHPFCFQYLATKYPHLESLSLDLEFNIMTSEELMIFYNAILNMLLQLPLLKKLSYRDDNSPYEDCLHYQFIKWLNQHPNQLTHLEYFIPLAKTNYKKTNEIYINNNDNIILQQQQQFNFLYHLTSLSLGIDDATDLVLTSLSVNKNTVIVLSTLNELEIQHYTNGKNFIMYFYDWLDIFPNLLLFKSKHGGVLTDNSHYHDDSYSHTSCKLHQLIKERKEQQQHEQHDHLNKRNDNHTSYKLEYLEIERTHVRFINGFDEPLKECHNLKKLVLTDVTINNPPSPFNGIHLDLSHLYLEFVKLEYISFTTYNSDDLHFITKLIIHETLTDSKRIFEKTNRTRHLILNLKCKFIDGFTYRLM